MQRSESVPDGASRALRTLQRREGVDGSAPESGWRFRPAFSHIDQVLHAASSEPRRIARGPMMTRHSVCRSVVCAFSIVLLGILLLGQPPPTEGQTWTELSTVGGPTSLDFHGFVGDTVAYDPTTNRLIVFLPRSIGFTNEFPEADPTGQVWVLANANGLGGPASWTKLNAVGTVLPAIHSASTAVYDAATNRLIVYGGGFYHSSPPLNGTFVLDHANGLGGTPTWSVLGVTNASCSPSGQAGSCTGAHARLGNTSVFDPASARMISFGGDTAFFGTGMNDTRALTNANGLAGPSTWMTLSPSGAPPSAIRLDASSVRTGTSAPGCSTAICPA